MSVLVACKNEEDSKMKVLEWSRHYSLIFTLRDFDAQGQLTLAEFQTHLSFMRPRSDPVKFRTHPRSKFYG